MDPAVASFFGGPTSVSVTPGDGYQQQFMDLVTFYILGQIPDNGFGTRKPIEQEGLLGISQDKNYPQFAEMSETISGGGLHCVEHETRQVIKSRG
jgi:hypothetical protein